MIVILSWIARSERVNDNTTKGLTRTTKCYLRRIFLRHFSIRAATVGNLTRGVFVLSAHVCQGLQESGAAAPWLSEHKQHLSTANSP